jgi:hypothetical protein
MKAAWIIVFSALLCFCSKNGPGYLKPSEKRLAAAYAELLKLSARIPPGNPAYQDSAAAVLKRLRFTKEDFDRGTASFKEDPGRWEAFYREVQTLLSVSKSSEAVLP